ncbi:MAG: tetratricopeptide repeat protein [Bacteroidales bacterium]|nr:tetratricopeptide repeat protein [Bacteroidales bacterium]
MVRSILLLLLVFSLLINRAYSQAKWNDAVLTEADSLLDIGQYEQSILKFQEYLIAIDRSDDELDEIISVCYERIGRCYYKLDKYADAIDWFQKALDLQRERGDLEAAASSMNNIGLNYKMRGNYDKAIEYYEQTIRIDEELGKGLEIAKTLNNIGMVYRVWGKYDKAIEYFERSLRQRNSLNDQAGVSKSMNNIGLVYTEWKKYDQAILNFRESLKIEESLNNESEIAIRLNNLGRVYFYMNQYDTALVYFNKTLLIHQKNNDLDQIALAFNNIGKVYLNQVNYEEAGNYLSSALSIFHDLGREGEKATVLANLSDISRAMGNDEKAIRLLDSSTVIANRLNLRNQLQQNYLYYSEIYSALKDYKKSLEYYKKYSETKDSVFSEEVLSQLSDFQIKYETEKKENEIVLLKKNEVIQSLALKKETIFRNFMLAVSGLFLALAGMIFYSLQLKKKDNKIIAMAREKSDLLLLNILPAGIAQDLKETGKTEPKVFGDVTACFVDIVNFTHKTTTLEPVILIDELNQIFTAFDNIIEMHGCERIKTIGDCYMAVAGLPEYNPWHAKQLVKCCIDMMLYIRQRNLESVYKWEIRAGVHSGEVIAGVVGVKKYIYDVFGDTINTASRMESNSEPMRINISESTYNLVKNDFETEFRGELEVRGKGKLRMYFIKS